MSINCSQLTDATSKLVSALAPVTDLNVVFVFVSLSNSDYSIESNSIKSSLAMLLSPCVTLFIRVSIQPNFAMMCFTYSKINFCYFGSLASKKTSFLLTGSVAIKRNLTDEY